MVESKKLFFSKDELEECTNETYDKLKVYLPRCKKEVALSIGRDEWGLHYISYGDMDEMSELVNIILEWKHKAEAKQ